MFNILRPFLSRIVAAAIATAFGVVERKTGITVDPATQASITAGVVVGVYGVAHRLLDKKLNPADTASSHLATEGVAAAEAAKGGV